MNSTLFYFYGIFLITCGIVSVIFIGPKAKTALMSGGMSGVLSIVIAYFIGSGSSYAPIFGLILPGGLLIVFAWRSTKTLFKIFELLQASADNPDSYRDELNGKGIAFLIISLMAVTSLFVFILQVTQII
jgi:hypothetical protein